jgi:hypothetical protein
MAALWVRIESKHLSKLYKIGDKSKRVTNTFLPAKKYSKKNIPLRGLANGSFQDWLKVNENFQRICLWIFTLGLDEDISKTICRILYKDWLWNNVPTLLSGESWMKLQFYDTLVTTVLGLTEARQRRDREKRTKRYRERRRGGGERDDKRG